MTTVKIPIKGDIVSDDMADVYDFFGYPYASPNQVADVLKSVQPNDDIEIDINSGGGIVEAGSEIYTVLKNLDNNTTVQIQGLAASAASVIAMAGDNVEISPTAQIMIHKASATTDGNSDDLRNFSDVLDSVDAGIAQAYEIKTGMPADKLLQMMSNETWMNAQQAVDNGFADEVMFTKDKKAPSFAASTHVVPNPKTARAFNQLKAKAQAYDQEHKEKDDKEKSKTPDAKKEPSLTAQKLKIAKEILL